jgi:hypothetical protein
LSEWWIDDRRNGDAVKFMLRPFDAEDMDCYRVSPLVNNAKNDSDWPQRFVVTGSQFRKIVEAVTDELLQWTTELEKRGIKGEEMNFDEKEKQSATNQIFNIQKLGVLGNVINSQVAFHLPRFS